MKFTRLTLFAALAAGFFCGCEKSPSETALPTIPPSSPPQTIARIHWLGKKQIAAETNSAGLMRIWNEPESARLESQTLDKLSTAPWRLFPHVATTNSAAATLLRPLLDDCIRQESYLEIRCATNQPGELAFAIRLDAARAALWKTNLAAVLESLTGIRAAPAQDGWSLKKHEMPNLIELVEEGEWIIVGIGQSKNALLANFAMRIQRDHAPFAAAETNFWVDATLNLPRVADAFALDWNLPADFPNISMSATGDGENVRTRGELTFPEPLPFKLEPWNIPTNWVPGSFVGFAAARGVAPFLGKLKLFSDFPSNSVPNQVFLWNQFGVPPPVFCAFSVNDASNDFGLVAVPILRWLTTNVAANSRSVQIDTNAILVWNGLPFAYPVLQAVTIPGQQLLLAGTFPPTRMRNKHMPEELMEHMIQLTNLIYFDWESTGQRLLHWRFLHDIVRILFDVRGPLLERETDSLQWVERNHTNLSYCVTEVNFIQTNRLAFARKSLIGLSALEIEFLANWLETPEFPCGFQSLLITNPLPVVVTRKIPQRAIGAENH